MEKELILNQLVLESSGCASYIIASQRTKKSLLVDPLTDIQRYESYLRQHGLQLVGLVDTHTHADHLSGMRTFSKIFPRACLAMHENTGANMINKKLKEGDHLEELVGESSSSVKVLFTPGHATDHICLLLENTKGAPKLLSGDCLLIGDVGRTDLGRGDNDKMYDSLFHKLLLLPPETQVYPAHLGAKHFLPSEKSSTTIGAEKNTNPALLANSKEDFVTYMTEGWPPKPENYKEIIEVNLGKRTAADLHARA